jgi:hypothetical protein
METDGFHWGYVPTFQADERINAVAKALDNMTGEDADRIVVMTMIVKECSSLEAEAALLIVDLNNLGYDIVKTM